MSGKAPQFSLPRWRLTRWLADAGSDVPAEIRVALIGSLFGTLPIFAGGVINTLAVSFLIALRIPTLPFIAWCGFEVVCCLVRLLVLIVSQRRAAKGQPTPTDLYLLLGIAWAAGIGYGTFISLTSSDWVAATLACLSAAAMVGGICFRNFGAPRMAGLMIFLTLGSCCTLETRLAQPGEPRRLAVIYLDLDGFKAVNDTHGHMAGDRLLQRVAERLRGMLRSGDLVARIGGDEFIVLSEQTDTAHLRSFGERLIREISQPYDLDNRHWVSVGASVGVALAPEHGHDMTSLLTMADAALYQAKSLGKSRCVIADGETRILTATPQRMLQ